MPFKSPISRHSGSFPSIFRLATAVPVFFSLLAIASPDAKPLMGSLPARVPRPKLPSDHKIKSWVLPVKPDTCLFYTNELKEVATGYAREHGLVTVWDAYQPFHTDYHKPPLSTYTDDLAKEYYQKTARVFAKLCSGKVWIMIPPNQKPCGDSIFETDELDVIKDRSKFGPLIYLQSNNRGLISNEGKYVSPPEGENNDHESFDQICRPSPRFTGNDPINYWGN